MIGHTVSCLVVNHYPSPFIVLSHSIRSPFLIFNNEKPPLLKTKDYEPGVLRLK